MNAQMHPIGPLTYPHYYFRRRCERAPYRQEKRHHYPAGSKTNLDL